MSREKLASRIGFILLSAGCAIGLGNVWRFPYIVGKNGGAWFVLIYLAALVLIGIPVLVMEFAAGRAAQRSIVRLHETLTPERRFWRVHGLAGMIGNIVLMMFYTTVTGWLVIYFFKISFGSFASAGLSPAAVGDAFDGMLGDAKTMTVAMLGVSLGAAGVCAIGLQKGLERITKVLMFALLVLIAALAVNSLRLPNAGKGVSFYLVPSLANLKAAGVANVIVEAMNQAFFTLSLGIGAMAIFGSYIGKERSLLGEALTVGMLDTTVAIIAGLIIIPACFAFGIAPGQGPGLIFVTLPNVFSQMPFGRLWGALFFLFMSSAALTTVLAVFETILACLCDYTGMSRRRGCFVLAIAIPLLSMPCILGFNAWSSFQPFGKGSCVLDLEDFVVTNILLPLGAIAFTLYCSHRFGWGWRNFVTEANEGRGPKIRAHGVLRVYCGYILPAIVFVIFGLGLWGKFAK